MKPYTPDNPLGNFVIHGVLTVSAGDTYILMVDDTGQAVIKYVSENNLNIRYTEMTPVTLPEVNGIPVAPSKDSIATAIVAFWNGPITSYNYVFLFQL